jgi:hypothetical protein
MVCALTAALCVWVLASLGAFLSAGWGVADLFGWDPLELGLSNSSFFTDGGAFLMDPAPGPDTATSEGVSVSN